MIQWGLLYIRSKQYGESPTWCPNRSIPGRPPFAYNPSRTQVLSGYKLLSALFPESGAGGSACSRRGKHRPDRASMSELLPGTRYTTSVNEQYVFGAVGHMMDSMEVMNHPTTICFVTLAPTLLSTAQQCTAAGRGLITARTKETSSPATETTTSQMPSLCDTGYVVTQNRCVPSYSIIPYCTAVTVSQRYVLLGFPSAALCYHIPGTRYLVQQLIIPGILLRCMADLFDAMHFSGMSQQQTPA